jgi:hypothetical protein
MSESAKSTGQRMNAYHVSQPVVSHFALRTSDTDIAWAARQPI